MQNTDDDDDVITNHNDSINNLNNSSALDDDEPPPLPPPRGESLKRSKINDNSPSPKSESGNLLIRFIFESLLWIQI